MSVITTAQSIQPILCIFNKTILFLSWKRIMFSSILVAERSVISTNRLQVSSHDFKIFTIVERLEIEFRNNFQMFPNFFPKLPIFLHSMPRQKTVSSLMSSANSNLIFVICWFYEVPRTRCVTLILSCSFSEERFDWTISVSLRGIYN